MSPAAKASLSVEIDTTEITRLAHAVPQLGWILQEEMDRAMDESGALLTTLVAARMPVNYGIARASVSFPQGFSRSPRGADEIEGLVKAYPTQGIGGVSTVEYVTYLETGTRPHWPPIAPLKLWAIRKGLGEKAAYAVQAAIASRGTPAVQMFHKAWQADGGEQRVREIWERVPVRAIERFAAAH